MLKQHMPRAYSLYIIRHADEHNQRTGQYLFNSLPVEAAQFITSTLFDPFHRDMSQDEVEAWISDHIIFDDNGRIMALFNNNDILWERGW